MSEGKFCRVEVHIKVGARGYKLHGCIIMM